MSLNVNYHLLLVNVIESKLFESIYDRRESLTRTSIVHSIILTFSPVKSSNYWIGPQMNKATMYRCHHEY